MHLSEKADVIIIGGGIIGTAIARELAKFKVDVILLEQNPELAMATTKANSGILHAGFDAHEGSVRAVLNVRGNELYRNLQDDLGLEIKQIGSLVVAKNQEEMKVVEELFERGRKNGVPGLEILSREQVLAREPNLSPEIVGALSAPTAGIIVPFGAALAFAENAVRNGVKVYTECKVEKIAVEKGKVTGVQTNKGFCAADYVINAGGLFADTLSQTAGDNSFAITPRKGEYILFDKTVGNLVNSVVFPTPSKVSKGILVAPTVHGNLFIGPNAISISDKEDLSTSMAGLGEIIAGAKRTVPNLPMGAAITQFAGLRAVSDNGDFVVEASKAARGLIQAAGIQSPGLTAAPAIAEMVASILREEGLQLVEKTDFVAQNPPKVCFNELDNAGKEEIIAKNPLYGRIICRCETVTEGEIVDAIRRPCGARTVDGVKRRTRAGMGRCQGGFCGPRVTAILARELNIPITAVRKDTAESYLFFDKITRDCEVSSHE